MSQASILPRLMGRILRSAIGAAVYAAFAFLGAGRLDWPRGWLYAAIFASVTIIGTIVVELCNPGLLAARAKGVRQDTKPFDRVFYRLFLPLMIFYPLCAGLDAERFGWAALPWQTAYIGGGLFLLGSLLSGWTMAVNRNAEATVRIQDDRGHAVVSHGPYALVRHPMYLGTLIGLPGTALILGSGWALVPMALIMVLFVWRTAREDATLHDELNGYRAYAQKTRYRLFPGVW